MRWHQRTAAGDAGRAGVFCAHHRNLPAPPQKTRHTTDRSSCVLVAKTVSTEKGTGETKRGPAGLALRH